MTWKCLERRLAALLGGKRVPVTGRSGKQGQESPDIEHPIFSIEVKHRGDIPKWLRHACQQAEASRKPHHLAAVAILHQKQQRLEDCAVVMPLRDLLAIQDLVSNPAKNVVRSI